MKRYLCAVLLAATFALSGCAIITPPPNPAAVLEGTWQAVFDEPGDLEGYDIQLTFDDNGSLVEITAESPEGATARLDVDNATETGVDGDQVTVTIPSAGGTRSFTGTLSEDENSIDGSLSQELELPSGDLDVTLPGQALVLERIQS
jgi:hypothetical protein